MKTFYITKLPGGVRYTFTRRKGSKKYVPLKWESKPGKNVWTPRSGRINWSWKKQIEWEG